MLAATTFETFTIGLVGAAVPVSLGAWFVRRKTKAETADLITQASARVVEMLEARITDLENRLAAEQAERAALNLRLLQAEDRERAAVARIAELQAEVSVLKAQIKKENPS